MSIQRPDISDRSDVRKVVAHFYEKAVQDGLLAPIFETVKDAPGQESFYEFWECMLTTGPNEEMPEFLPHIHLMFSRRHFTRWLNLFLETVDAHYAGPNTDNVKLTIIRKSEEFQASPNIIRF